MSDIPNPRLELERKTIEFLEQQVTRLQQGRISNEEVALLGRSLWTVTAGLVDEEVLRLCQQVGEAYGPAQVFKRFIGNGKLMTISWNPEQNGYLLETKNATTLEATSKKASVAMDEREEQLKKLFYAIGKTGYVEI